MARIVPLPAPGSTSSSPEAKLAEALRAALAADGGPWIDVEKSLLQALDRVATLRDEGEAPPAALVRRVARDVASAALVMAARPGAAPGDAAARDRLIALWQDDVSRWCQVLGGPGVSAEDAAHDALLVACTRLGKLVDPLAFRAWLWAVTWRTVRRHRRRAWLRRWVPGGPPERPDPRGDAGERYERAERAARVMQALDRLPPDQRELLWLAYAEGMTRAELCRQLELGPGVLSRRLTRARAAFEAVARELGLEAQRYAENEPNGRPGGAP